MEPSQEIITRLVIRLAFIDIPNSSLRRICIYTQIISEKWHLERAGVLTNGSHVAQHLRSIDADPIEGGVRERISG